MNPLISVALLAAMFSLSPPYIAEESNISSELQEVIDNQKPLGDIGRLIIPDVGVDVAVYRVSKDDNDYAQSMTNASDSAVYMPWTETQEFIADHWNQGFININDCKEGTKAYLKQSDRIITYTCTETTKGHNLLDFILIETTKDHSYKLFSEQDTESGISYIQDGLIEESNEFETYGCYQQGQPLSYYITPHEWTVHLEDTPCEETFWGQPIEYINDYDVFMYTCDGRWQDIIVCLFQEGETIYLD